MKMLILAFFVSGWLLVLARLPAQSPSPNPAQAAAQSPSPDSLAPPVSANAPVHFRWAAGGVLIARPTAGEGICYFLSKDRAAYALDDNGRVLFRADLDLSPQAIFTPLRAGSLFIVDGSRVLRVNRSGGISLSFQQDPRLGEHAYSPVEGFDGRVFVAGTHLSCYSVSGLLKWALPLPSPAALSPVLLSDGSVALGLSDGTILALDAFGKESFRYPAQGKPLRLIPGQAGALAILRSGGGVELYHPQRGSLPLASGIVDLISSPEEGQGYYALDASAKLSLLDPEGRLAWKIDVGRGFERLKAYPGRVYAMGKERILACTRTGTALREIELKNAAVEPEIGPAGIVFSGGRDWIVYAYRFDIERAGVYGSSAPGALSGSYGLEGYDRRDYFGYPGLSDSSFQEKLLDDVENSLKSGNMGEGERYALALCSALARSKLDADSGYAQKKEGYFPQVRARACRLLGILGSIESRQVLIQVMRKDPEPAVKAAAADALGLIAWDGDGASLDALEEISSRAPWSGWDSYLISAAHAVKRISIYEGVPVSDRGIAALMRLADGPYAQAVKKGALDALYAVHASIQRR